MYTAIKAYCENEGTNGLCLIDMPTGFGKTYSVLNYIFDACQKEENRARRYFFITPLKKNLPIEELKQRFKDSSKLAEFKEKVLFIDSNVDTVIENYTDELGKEIPDDIKKTEEYKNFQQELAFLKQQMNSDYYQVRQMAKGIERNFRERTEPTFRRLLQRMLGKAYPTVAQRIHAIKTENKWRWLGKLYPAVFTQDRQIFFMSMDKFLTRNATIVEPPYQFYNNKLIDNAIIFIDEFDSTKDTMLNNIIQNGLRDKIDFIELFKSIYSAMETNDFPTVLTTPSQQRIDGSYKKTLQNVLDDTRKKAEDLYSAYTLQFNHRTSEDSEDTFKNFLFQDHQFHTIFNNNSNKFITTVSDTKAKINVINFTPEKPQSENSNIHIMLGKLRGFIGWFQITVNILATNYRQLKNENLNPGEDEFTHEQAIRTVLSLFRLSPYETDYLTSQIMMASRRSKSEKIAGSVFDRTLYEHGFRYYCFENDTMHDMQSKIMMCSFQNTPEKLLLRFCERAKVVGISATATVPTVIGNFDLEYLRSKMQETFYLMPLADKQRLQCDFEASQIGYRDIQIHTNLIGIQNYSKQIWIDSLQDQELAEEVFNKLERSVYEINQNNYNKERYARIAKTFKEFLLHDDIRSMLCLLTKYPSKDDKLLDIDLLMEIFSYISQTINPSFSPNRQVVVLRGTGEEFDNNKDEILNRLAKGEKLFVISVYQAIGAGQNLQYSIPEALKDELVQSNTHDSRGEKDFDAIYLDQPTNLLVNFEDNWDEERFVKYLFQIEFFQENAELSTRDALEYIKKAFQCYQSGLRPPFYPKSLKDKKGLRLYATRAVIQAIGRICRTNMKCHNIYIFADDRIADYLDLSVTNGRILNYEFLALVEKIKGTQIKQPEQASLEDKASLVSYRVNRDIDYMLNDAWDAIKMDKWSQLRRLVLQNPTASSEDAEKNFIYYNYYVQLPQKSNMLFYSQEEDFHRIDVSFTKTQLIQSVLNEANTRLDRLMRWQPLREYFTSQGFATEFVPNDYIMSPPLWNNIYKGALGEVAGLFWFKQIVGVQPEELTNPEQFEKFDFKVPRRSIYVDFKNWSENTVMPREETINKIASKAEKCGCNCVIIANILSSTLYECQNFVLGNTRFLIVPSLLNDDGEISVNKEALSQIRRCLNAFAD